MSRSFSNAIVRCALASGLLAAVTLVAGMRHFSGRAAAATKMTLTFYDGGLYSGTKAIKAVVTGYEKLHPNVTVKVIPYSGNYVTDIATALAGGTAADVVIPTAMPQIWADVPKGYWVDLTPFVDRPDPYLPHRESLAAALQPSALRQERYYNGKFFALSATSIEAAFFYNKQIFAKAGIKAVPTTWAQFIADLQKIKAAGYVPLEAPLAAVYNDPILDLLSVLEGMAMGRTITRLDLNHDGVVDIRELALGLKSHTFGAHNPEFQAALRLYAQLYPYMERGAAGVNYSAGLRAFINGRGAVYYDGLWSVSSIDSAHPSFTYDFFPVPQVTRASNRFATPGYHGTGLWGATGAVAYAVSANAVKRGHLAQAIDFIEYLMSYHNTDVLDTAITGVSVLKGAHNPPRLHVVPEIAAHLSPFALAEQTMPPQYTTLRHQLLVDYLTAQKSWNDVLNAMQQDMDTNARQVLASLHLT
jgi:ABC-type glycerol-3-phosphate transport system substrate-binding protein